MNGIISIDKLFLIHGNCIGFGIDEFITILFFILFYELIFIW